MSTKGRANREFIQSMLHLWGDHASQIMRETNRARDTIIKTIENWELQLTIIQY
jgi:hypothetical protein